MGKNYNKKRIVDSSAMKQEYEYHLPVMLEKSIELLITSPDGVYIDGTLGGGGHTAEILKRIVPGGGIIAFDKDKIAINHCSIRFKEELDKGKNSRLVLVNDCFSKACSINEHRGQRRGLLLDLGVSSRQLDTNQGGISYRVNADLDMRFGGQNRSAEGLINSATLQQLIDILRNYGEEPYARKIANNIISRRKLAPLKTTYDLRQIIEEVTPKHFHSKTLSRVFQAFRIAVNDELNILETTLINCIPTIQKGGRIVVISYHSLEDRIVKNIFKQNSVKKRDGLSITPTLKLLTKKPLIPSDEEISKNPRARSAKLRAAEKL